jgi:D-amino peptidase
MRKRFLSVLMGLLCFFVLTIPGQKRLKVVVLYDMEGVSGVINAEGTDFDSKPDYEPARQSLTADVNAAIAGLKAGGATEIIVVDGHGSGNSEGPDVFEDQLLPPAKMISRDRAFDIYMDSYDQSVDAIVAIGMHAGAGNPAGFLSHTYTSEDVQYTVNGIPFNESMILAMGAARYGIPLIMVSGDDRLEVEIRRYLPAAKYAVGKHAVDRSKAEPFPRDEVNRRIEAAAREALQALDSARLPAITSGPYRFALSFQDEAQARYVGWLQAVEATSDPTKVEIRAADFEEGYRASLRLISAAGLVGRYQALQRVINEQPNAAALQKSVGAYMTDRWLNRLPAPSKTAAAGAPTQRYWGAR